MAFFTEGKFSDFSVTYKSVKKASDLLQFNSINDLHNIRKDADPNDFQYAMSSQSRSIYLKSITLNKSFEGFLANMFKPNNEIYFLSYAWDLSGKMPFIYPRKITSAEDCIFQLKAGDTYQFMGEGVCLFPHLKVTAGVNLRIYIWESDKKARQFGEVMEKIANEIEKSELNQLFTLVSALTTVTGATITMIEKAAIELSKVVANILKNNTDDQVDFFDGFFPASADWNSYKCDYAHQACNIQLQLK